MNPYVKSVKTQEDYRLLLTFENGEKRVFDLTPYLEKPVFKPLRNLAAFQTARVVSGSVEWLGEVDLSYDTLYLESEPVKGARPARKAGTSTRRQKKVAIGATAREKKRINSKTVGK